MAILVFFLLYLEIVSGGQMNERIYSRAYSYLAVKGQRSSVCYDDRMDIITKLKAASSFECILKCLIATANNLRGINFVKPYELCSCIPKVADILYNVTGCLTGCEAFVEHGCPGSFNYVMEQHKCFSIQITTNQWLSQRSTCNNMLNSHPVVIESYNENLVVRLYTLAVLKSTALCPLPGNSGKLALWIGLYSTFNNSKRLPYMWAPYPKSNNRTRYDSVKLPQNDVKISNCMVQITIEYS
ncbi:hypothetical protein HELRODRAFT_172159 [Helobdella robusta]|uniref:C-type lectin domain-containing protein n=1 Tax=Helobdella robusta TaxID=6412 RepID=T1F532_HELRO|nr:hypothetical protein HELRODRAFT_172159 [Helobdella robusta]ESO04512.1 hypothetical protein HELRODRAFT_172159 [Helobdella robusta]